MEPSAPLTQSLDLAIVIPVYNERASIRKVVSEWHQEVSDWTNRFRLLVINDGSTDGTLDILENLRETLGERLEIVTQPNAGHGQACLYGYRLAIARGAEFILQVDSDGQCDPQYFFKFWRLRDRCDVVYGVRRSREDGFRRVVASWVLRAFVVLFGRTVCRDANVPYRLMRSTAVAPFIDRVPSSFHLANIGLAVLLKRADGLRHGYVPIRFRERYGGEPHVPLAKFGAKALELHRDFQTLFRS